MSEIVGALICTTGGLAGAMFALPFRGVKNWRYESYWLVYALVGQIACPVALAGFVCPNLWMVLRSASGATLLRCFGFWILWGFGGLTWGADVNWAGMPVLVVVLSGGFVVNAVWCLWQNIRNRSFGDYRRGVGPWLLAGLAVAIWVMQFVCQKIGEPALGSVRYISFALVMGSCVLFSSVLGVVLGEWRGTGFRTKLALSGGLVLLTLSIALVAVAKGL